MKFKNNVTAMFHEHGALHLGLILPKSIILGQYHQFQVLYS